MTGVRAHVCTLVISCVEMDRTMILIMVDAFLLVDIVVLERTMIVQSEHVARIAELVTWVNTGILTINNAETLTLTVAVVREPVTITT